MNVVNDGRRSSTLFPFVTQLNSPPRCSTTGPSKSWLQAIHCSALDAAMWWLAVSLQCTSLSLCTGLSQDWKLSLMYSTQVQHHHLKRKQKRKSIYSRMQTNFRSTIDSSAHQRPFIQQQFNYKKNISSKKYMQEVWEPKSINLKPWLAALLGRLAGVPLLSL